MLGRRKGGMLSIRHVASIHPAGVILLAVTAWSFHDGPALQDARNSSNTAALARKIQEYDDVLESYVPILMAQANIYWEMGQYSSVIKVLNQSREFASEHETWKLNLGHTYFMLVRVHNSIPLTVCSVSSIWRAKIRI
jgi:hypothetical protein